MKRSVKTYLKRIWHLLFYRLKFPFTTMSKKKPYLKQNRLADVLALIQILAFDEQSHRSVEQLNSELQGKPQSATSWKNIAKEHSEFFRFSLEQDKLHEDKGHTISLIARHAKLTNPTRIADTLSPDL